MRLNEQFIEMSQYAQTSGSARLSGAKPSADQPARFVPLAGVGNVRDLGGYPAAAGGTVRWRLLYRAGQLTGLSPADRAVLRDTLGVRTVLDLRRPAEVEPGLVEQCARAGIRHRTLPLGPDRPADQPDRCSGAAIELVTLLLRAFPAARPGLARLIRILASRGTLPAMLCCVLGRDRTGLAAAAVLSVLGVSDDAIVADYCLTGTAGCPAVWADRLQVNRGLAAPAELARARPEVMRAFLAGVRHGYGGMAAALAPFGAGPPVLASLRGRLLDRRLPH